MHDILALFRGKTLEIKPSLPTDDARPRLVLPPAATLFGRRRKPTGGKSAKPLR